MNSTKQQETEANIQQMIQKYQQAVNDNQTAFNKAQQEKMEPILKKIRTAIENVGKAGSYVYIMEGGAGQPIFINPALSKDLTAEVKAELNKMK